jgi:acetylornithine deacetylase/succinyl-diaminopimelate desuccinylase-like protein
MTDPRQYVDDNREKILDELFTFLRQPSISTRNEGVRECADLLSGMMAEVGIDARIIETARHPVVYGQTPEGGRPTMLVYGHYDVQPPEPLELWRTPPFEPTVVDGKIYCRGASDDKSQLFVYVKAVEAFRRTTGAPPVGLKFLYEGEEEIGSPNLKPFVESHLDLLESDLTVFSDSHIHESGRPSLILGLKGLVYLDLKVQCANRDQHSMRATSVPNAAWRLVWALSTLKGPDNRVRIPGFYDQVRELTPLEKEAVAAIPCDETALLDYFGLDRFLPGRFSNEYYYNLVSEPTCNIAGLNAGYTGEGSKTVLPAEASAKVDMRLVPNQHPEDIMDKFQKHLRDQGFDDVQVEPHHTLVPSRTPIDHPAVDIIAGSLAKVYGREPIVFPNIGGAGPNYIFTDVLGVPCFVVPHATHDQANHAPNESMDLEGFFKGIHTAIDVMEQLAQKM